MTDRVGPRFTLPLAAPLSAPLAQAGQDTTWLLWFLATLGALSFVAVVVLLIVMATRKGQTGYGPSRDRDAYPGQGYPPAPPPPWAVPPAPYPPSARPPAAAPPPYPGPPSPATPPVPGYPPWPAQPPAPLPPAASPYDRPIGSQPGPYGAAPPPSAMQSVWNRPAAEPPGASETGFHRAREQRPAPIQHPSLAETVMALHPSAAPSSQGKPEAGPPPDLNAPGKPASPKAPGAPCSPYSETVSVPPPARSATAPEEGEAAAETVKQTLVEDFDTSERLVAETGPLAGSSFPLFGKVKIGRAPDNDIVLADKKVSSHHAMINRLGPKLMVTDLNSTNGTVLNGIRITDPVAALYGDKLIVGDTRFVFS